MAPRTAALLAALAVAALAAAVGPAQAAPNVRPPWSLEDIGTGAPEAVNCSEEDPLEGKWLEITQASGLEGPSTGSSGLGPSRELISNCASGIAGRLLAAQQMLPCPSLCAQILNFTQYTSTPVRPGPLCADQLRTHCFLRLCFLCWPVAMCCPYTSPSILPAFPTLCAELRPFRRAGAASLPLLSVGKEHKGPRLPFHLLFEVSQRSHGLRGR